MIETKDVLGEIYARLDRAEAVKELNPVQRGLYYLLTCPQCGKREAYLYKSGVKINCSRLTNCRYSATLWDYLQSTKKLTNQETLKELANLSGYLLPELTPEKLEQHRRKEELLEKAHQFFMANLWGQEGRKTLVYLKNRGFSEGNICFSELGHNNGYEQTLISLTTQGYSEKEIKQIFDYLEWRNDYKLVIPSRDQHGRLNGFWGRLTGEFEIGKKEADKYKPFGKITKDMPFNLYQGKNLKTVILTEGYLDAVILTANGIEGVLAIGGAVLPKLQLEAIITYCPDVRNIILCLDSDQAGQDGTEKALGHILHKGLKPFIINLPADFKDPNDLIKAHGIEAFRQLLNNPLKWGEWKACRLLEKHKDNLSTSLGKENLIDEALNFDSSLPASRVRDGEDFLRVIANYTGYDLPSLTIERTKLEERKKIEQTRKTIKKFLKEGTTILEKSEGLAEIKDFLTELPKIKAKLLVKEIQPYSLQTLQEEILQTASGMLSGFDELDKIIRIPQEAITIIAGRPSHGKTTFMMNLFLNMVKGCKNKAFFFFSYEESRKQVGLKLINILSGETINEKRNLDQLEYYIRGRKNKTILSPRPNIEKGETAFDELAKSERLWIIDEPYLVEDLADTITDLKERYDVGAVFIDYIQKIKIKGRYQSRQIELQKVSEQILEIAKGLSIPIILGAQLGRAPNSAERVRLDNLRECGDIEQDANLVLGLYNEDIEKKQFGKEDSLLETSTVDLQITILKNRNGEVNKKVMLEFEKPTLRIRNKEIKKEDW